MEGNIALIGNIAFVIAFFILSIFLGKKKGKVTLVASIFIGLLGVGSIFGLLIKAKFYLAVSNLSHLDSIVINRKSGDANLSPEDAIKWLSQLEWYLPIAGPGVESKEVGKIIINEELYFISTLKLKDDKELVQLISSYDSPYFSYGYFIRR